MKIDALKFTPLSGPRPLQCYLELAKEQDVLDLKGGDLPTAYVIKARDLEVVRAFPDLVIDRGHKHKAKGLSKILLRQDKIPLINGDFTIFGQMRRSIRTLLSNARRAGEQNCYLIGTEDRIFGALWAQADRMEEVQTTRSGDAMVQGMPPQLLLDLLGQFDEPADLKRKYVGESVEARLVRRLILHAARVDDTVLILGDTGTGKEVVARAIHDYSNRGRETFISVNCGAIPRHLLESELFGHEKGSFTGAAQRKIGLWEIADRGTLLLDEIGDLPLEHQVKILRVLQEGRIRRVGGQKEVQVNARVIAATNRDLYSMVQIGHFREDLYYRLREFLIYTPALRDHPEDIPLLAQLFWRRIVQDEQKTLPPEILEELKSYRWPGNARELKTVFTNLRALFGVDYLRVEHLRAVFMLLGQAAMPMRQEPAFHVTELHQVECLRHLQRTREVINACEVTIRPLLANQGLPFQTVAAVQTSLTLRLNELEILCHHPLLFHSEDMFASVFLLRGKFAYFQGLLGKDVQAAIPYWQKEVVGDLNRIIARLTQKINLLSVSSS